MSRYVLRGELGWFNKHTGDKIDMPLGDFVSAPAVLSDVNYKSPLSGKEVTSRSQRREEMKVHGVREMDPSEHKPTYRKKKNAVRMGGEWNPDAGKPAHVDEAPYRRLSRDELPEKLRKSISK
jgi:hypothetical protein